MFISLSKFKLKGEFERIVMITVLHLSLFLIAKFYEFIRYEFSFLSFIGLILWFVYSRFFYKTVKNLFYTYWTMTLITSLFLISDLYSSLVTYNDLSLFYFYGLSLLLLVINSYMLRTPLFYPMVSWWEYDFRYRNDVKATIKYGDASDEGRIVDIRGEAGGIAFFEDLEIGSKVMVAPEFNDLNQEFEVEIVSKRKHSVGRPFIYGVKFIFSGKEDRNSFEKFSKFWQFERRFKQKAKILTGRA